MVAAMELGAVLVAILVAIVAGAVLGVALFAAARTRDGTVPAGPSADLELELRHLAEEQRRFGETLLHRLHEASASHLDHERRRATTELDGKKALIDQQLGVMTSELGTVGERAGPRCGPPQRVR